MYKMPAVKKISSFHTLELQEIPFVECSRCQLWLNMQQPVFNVLVWTYISYLVFVLE